MDETTIAIIAIAVTAVANVILQVMAMLKAKQTALQAVEDARLMQRATETAGYTAQQVKVKVAESTMDLNRKLDSLGAVTDKTHVLVNSNMAVQLKLNAMVTRRLADITKYPADVAAADIAEQLYHEHEVKQAKVDAKEGQP